MCMALFCLLLWSKSVRVLGSVINSAVTQAFFTGTNWLELVTSQSCPRTNSFCVGDIPFGVCPGLTLTLGFHVTPAV